MGQIQNKSTQQENSTAGTIYSYNQQNQPQDRSNIPIYKPINRPVILAENYNGNENLSDVSGYSSHIQDPKILDLKRPSNQLQKDDYQQQHEENLSYTETILNSSLKMFDITVLDKEDQQCNYKKNQQKNQEFSQSLRNIQNTLISVTEGINTTILDSINPYTLQQLLLSVSQVINNDFLNDNKQSSHYTELNLQTYVLGQIQIYNNFLTQLAQKLDGLLNLGIMKVRIKQKRQNNLVVSKIVKSDTKSSLLSQVQVEIPSQFMKNISLHPKEYYKDQYYSFEQDENYFQQLRDHTNLILKADLVEEIRLDIRPSKQIEASTCNKTIDNQRSQDSSLQHSERYTPSTASEFLQKSSQLRAEISSLMDRHKSKR